MKITTRTIHKLPDYRKVLAKELLKLGAELTLLDGTEVISIRVKKKMSLWVGNYVPCVPYNIGMSLTNKNYIYKILAANKIPVTDAMFIYHGQPNIQKAIASLEYPVVLKQENTQLAVPAITNIQSRSQLIDSIQEMSKFGQGMLIEKHISGNSYRVFYTQKGLFQVLKKGFAGSMMVSSAHSALNFTEQESYFPEADVHTSWLAFFEQVLKAFTPMPYISFSLKCDSLAEPISRQSPVVLEVYHSANQHFSQNLCVVKEKNVSVTDTLVEQEIAKCIVES